MSQQPRTLAQTDPLRIDDIRPNTPLRLDAAAALAYPDGSMTASGLRREAKRGRLVIERTAGKDYTTLAAIERMRELCHVQPREYNSGYARKNATPTAPSANAPCGLFGTDRAKSARAALRKIALAPNGQSASTSQTNTSPTEPGGVIPQKSSLRTS